MKNLLLAGLFCFGLNSFGQAPTTIEQLAYGNYVVWDDPAEQIMGRNVSFLEHMPSGSPSNPPLVIYLNGSSEMSTTAEWSHGFTTKSDNEGFIMVYLDSEFRTTMPIFDPANPASWIFTNNWEMDGSDDDFHEAFISNVIDHYVDNHGANPKKVYLVGQSRGAMITLDMIPLLSDKIAAFGSYAGNNRVGNIPAFTLPVDGSAPVIMIQGSTDPSVSYGSSQSLEGRNWVATETSLSELAILNGYAGGLPPAGPTINMDASDGCDVQRFVYGENLELLRINNGGHGWAGTNFDLALVDAALMSVYGIPSFESFFGNLCFDISATDEFWDFFEDKTLDCNNIAIYNWMTGTTSHPIQDGDYWTMFGGISRQEPGADPYLGPLCAGALQQLEGSDSEQNFANFGTDDFNIFPNPTNGLTTLDLNNLPAEPTKVSVTDLNGRVVNEVLIDRSFDNANGIVDLDLTNLENGIYLIQIQIGELIFHKKVVKF